MTGGRVAAARPCAAASFVRAKPEGSQHVALPAPGQIVAFGARQRLPLFAGPPAGIIAFGHVVPPSSCNDRMKISSRATLAAPSPRVRGEGGVSDLILATQPRPSSADQSHESFASKKIKGGGAPKRRNCPVGPRHASDVATRMRFGRGRALIGARSPFGAPPRL